MQPRLWVVLPFDDGGFQGRHTIIGVDALAYKAKYLNEHCAIFHRDTDAYTYAKSMSAVNGGRQYLVLSTEAVLYAAQASVIRKMWKNGELVPA